MSKKKWTKPKLIVLVRGRQEEGILALCKQYTANQAGPSNKNQKCYSSNNCSTACSAGGPS